MSVPPLPPLTNHYPQWSRTGMLTISSPSEDDVTPRINRLKKSPPCESFVSSGNGDAAMRIAQLEQNIRFLQDQHRVMLSSLHSEIEMLMRKNRDLQYQLVFSKEASEASSPKSNPVSLKVNEDEEVINMEKELLEAKEAVRMAELRCRHLQAMLETRAQAASCACNPIGAGGGSGSSTGGASCEEDATAAATAGGAAGDSSELTRRLAAAERLVRRLRREGADHRRELQSIKASLMASGRVMAGGRGVSIGGADLAAAHAHSPLSPHSQHTLHQQHFPPLQAYWHPHHGQAKEKSSKYQGRRRVYKERNRERIINTTSFLPNLPGKTRIPVPKKNNSEFAGSVQIGRVTSRGAHQRPNLPDLNLHTTPIHYANGSQHQYTARQQSNGYKNTRRTGNTPIDDHHQVNDSDQSPNSSRQGSELSSRHSYRARRYQNNQSQNQNGKPSDRT